jgi:hypothetical protein
MENTKMTNKNGLMAVAGLAGLAALKSALSGSKNGPEDKPDCVGDEITGKTGDFDYDIFEGHAPKTWFSLITDNLRHSKIPNDFQWAISETKRKKLESVVIPMEAGVSLLEIRDLLRGAGNQAGYKIFNHLTSKKKMSDKEADQKLRAILTELSMAFRSETDKHAYLCLRMFLESGSNVSVIGPNMQALFEHTKMTGISISDFKMPFDTMYIALPGFDGYIHHATSGYHCIRGVSIHKISPETYPDENFATYGITIWGKPKFSPITGYDDLFLFAGVPDMGPGDLDDYIEKVFHRPDFETKYQQPMSCVQDVIRAVKIAFNLIIYWSSVNDDRSLIHPEIKKLLDRLELLRERNRRLKPKSTKYRKNLDKMRDIKRKLPKERMFWIEKTDAEYKRDYHRKNSKRASDPNAPKRKSPRFHIRSGHWRVLNRGQDNEKTTWIEAMPVGGGDIAPRLWRSRLSRLV